MKYLLLSILGAYTASVLSCSSAFGAIALVANVAASTTNTTSVVTSAIDTTGANLLIVAVADLIAAPSGVMSDSKGNTWTAFAQHSGGGEACRATLYYAKAPVVGAANPAQRIDRQ